MRSSNYTIPHLGLVSLCFFIQFHTAFGQIPGYLGKRLFTTAYLSATPALFSATANNKSLSLADSEAPYGGGESKLGINTRFGAQVGYVTSRKNAVTFTADYLNTGLILQNVISPSLSPFGTTNDFDRHYLFYNLHGITAGLGYQVYDLKKGAIAPNGSYVSYHLTYSLLRGDVLDKQTTFSDGNAKTHARLGIDPKYSTTNFGIEWGQNIVFKDRYLFNFALNFNLPLKIFKYLSPASENSPEHYSDYKDYNQFVFNDRATWRMAGHSFLTVRAAIGLLP